MRQFTTDDVTVMGDYKRIYADQEDLIYSPPTWMISGWSGTLSEHGKRLNSAYMICLDGEYYRIYSDNGTSWFKVAGERIVVS